MKITAEAWHKRGMERLQSLQTAGFIDDIHVAVLLNHSFKQMIEIAETTQLQDYVMNVPLNAVADLTRKQIGTLLQRHGIRKILLVSGSPLREPGPHGMIEMIRYLVDEGIQVSVAAYPEGYFSRTSARHTEKDIDILRRKTEAGASGITTQVVFDSNHAMDWLRQVRTAEIACPVEIGVMAPARPSKSMGALLGEAIKMRRRHLWQVIRHWREEADLIWRLLRSRTPSFSWADTATACVRSGAMREDDGIHIIAMPTDCREALTKLRAIMQQQPAP